MKQLEAEGLIAKRRGRSGGSFVLDRGAEGTSELSAELRRRRTEIEHALDFRMELEPAVAALAAERAGDEVRAELRGLAERVGEAEDDNAFERLDTRFHLRVADATGNRFFVDGVEAVRRQLNLALLALPESRLWHERSVAEHEAIVSAIEAREAELARVAMRVHVSHTDQSIRAMLSTL
jgi:GntR family transcriptional repressor for pyruvate dehydrogenase complex